MTGLASVVVHAVSVCQRECALRAQVNKVCLSADKVLRLSGVGRRPALTSRTRAGCCSCVQGRDRAASPAALPPARTPGDIAALSASYCTDIRGARGTMQNEDPFMSWCSCLCDDAVINQLQPDPKELHPKISS